MKEADSIERKPDSKEKRTEIDADLLENVKSSFGSFVNVFHEFNPLVAVFGSWAKGLVRTDSDLDLFVVLCSSNVDKAPPEILQEALERLLVTKGYTRTETLFVPHNLLMVSTAFLARHVNEAKIGGRAPNQFCCHLFMYKSASNLLSTEHPSVVEGIIKEILQCNGIIYGEKQAFQHILDRVKGSYSLTDSLEFLETRLTQVFTYVYLNRDVLSERFLQSMIKHMLRYVLKVLSLESSNDYVNKKLRAVYSADEKISKGINYLYRQSEETDYLPDLMRKCQSVLVFIRRIRALASGE